MCIVYVVNRRLDWMWKSKFKYDLLYFTHTNHTQLHKKMQKSVTDLYHTSLGENIPIEKRCTWSASFWEKKYVYEVSIEEEVIALVVILEAMRAQAHLHYHEIVF